MARGVRDRLDATWGMATTGVAGPDRQEGRAVGTVWVAIAGPGGGPPGCWRSAATVVAIRQAACGAVLELLARELGEHDHPQTEVTRREEGGLG